MKLAQSRLPLLFVTLGGLLMIVSFAWGYLIPATLINEHTVQVLTEAASRGHETASADNLHGSTTRPTDTESLSEDEVRARESSARAELDRKLFIRDKVPKFINIAGVILAVIGCILYPLQLLARQAQVEAEKAEVDGTTVVE